MELEPLSLNGPCIIHGKRHADNRGWFEESWSRPSLDYLGFCQTFEQDNLSFSARSGTLRGLHYQAPPMAQGKLLRVITGAITDVLVDVRLGSAHFGRHLKIDLSADQPRSIWVPQGFLHGFITRKPDTCVQYKVTRAYSHPHDGVVRWNDPQLAIDWGVDDPILSDKDANAPSLAELGSIFAEGDLDA